MSGRSEYVPKRPQDQLDVPGHVAKRSEAAGQGGIAEAYRENRLEIHAHLLAGIGANNEQPSEFCAVIESGERAVLDKHISETGEDGPESRMDGATRDDPVLIEVVEYGEQFEIRSVPSVVRLQSLDECSMRIPDPGQEPVLGASESIGGWQFVDPRGMVEEDRELGVVSGTGADRGRSKLPHEIVERGSKVVGEIARDDSDVEWDRLVGNLALGDEEPSSGLRVYLGHDVVRVRTPEHGDLSVKFFEMKPRPSDLRIGFIKRMRHP